MILSWSENVKNYSKAYLTKTLSLITSKKQKRVSFPFPSFSLNASMALEGSFIVPLFLFFMMTLLFCLEIIRFQSDVYEAMHQIGEKACMEAYRNTYQKEKTEAFNLKEIKGGIGSYLQEQSLPYICVKNGCDGVKVEAIANDQDDLQIKIMYQLKPFPFGLPIGEIYIQNHYLGHGFTGYAGNEERTDLGMEELVYITRTGTKYHRSENCTYLKIKIKGTSKEEMNLLRNASGEKYYPCESCKPRGNGQLYYTEWGNRYHGSSNCSALKRIIEVVPLSEVSDRMPCSKCG